MSYYFRSLIGSTNHRNGHARRKGKKHEGVVGNGGLRFLPSDFVRIAFGKKENDIQNLVDAFYPS